MNYYKFSNSLPIIEIHNTWHALQNKSILTGSYARVNWQCFAKNRQNNFRNTGNQNWPKNFFGGGGLCICALLSQQFSGVCNYAVMPIGFSVQIQAIFSGWFFISCSITNIALEFVIMGKVNRNSSIFSWRKYVQFVLQCIPEGPIDSTATLLQAMAYRRTGNKLLLEPKLTKFCDFIWRQ